MNVDCLFEESPDFEEVLQLKSLSSVQLNPLLNELISQLEEELTFEEELAFIRLLNILKLKKDSSFFEKLLNTVEVIDDREEEIKDSMALYLTEMVTDEHFNLVYAKLTNALEEEDFENIGLFLEILLKTSVRNDQWLKTCIEIFQSNASGEYERCVIAEKLKNPEIVNLVDARLKYLAPFKKYLDNKLIPHASEFNELIHSQIPDGENELTEPELDDVCKILAHTDERTSSIILDRAEKALQDFTNYKKRDLREKLVSKYLDCLPSDSSIWLMDTEGDQAKEFIYYEKAIISRLKSSNKLGRNDPCFCGSGLKYKKCHLDK